MTNPQGEYDTNPAPLGSALADRYALERELGRGGMATVFLAHDLKHDRKVALKLLRPELGEILGAERFLREIQLTARLQHPHILPLHDSGEATGQFFYVMPYVEGESLRARLRREGPLPLDEALRLTREVAEALDYAHQQGIIHRDIKPENILLSRGHALVADFGIALAVTQAGGGRLTETGLSLGTPAYMSPEQAMAEPRLDSRTDQYSLACVTYEMLAGEPPYTGPTAQAIIAKRLSEPLPRLGTLRQVPPGVEAAISRALAKAPADRFRTPGEFAQALLAPSAPARPRRSASRRRSARLVALATVLALLGAGGWLELRHYSPAPAPTPVRSSVAVLPFAIRGNPSLDYLREGLVELLSAKLDGSGDLRAVDPRAMLSLARRRSVLSADPVAGRQLAEQFGAVHYVLGSVLQVGDSLRLNVALYEKDGTLRANAEAGTVERELGHALDDVARSLIGKLSSTPADRLASLGAVTTTSFPALRAFLAGQQAFRRSDTDSAMTAFRTAVTLDSTFALAWYRLGTAAAWANREDVWREAIEQAVRRADRLSARDRDLLEANLSWREGRLNDAEQRYHAIVAAHPDDVEAWFWLGDVQMHTNAFRGRSPLEAELAFRRALSLDPEEWQSALHLKELLGRSQRDAAADSLLASPPGLGALSTLLQLVRTPERFDSLMAELLASRDVGSLHFLAMVLLRGNPVARDAGLKMAHALAAPSQPPDWQALAHGLLATHALAHGRWREADAELTTAERVALGHGVAYRTLLTLNAPISVPDSILRNLRRALQIWNADSVLQRSGSIQGDPRSWLDAAQPLAREYLLALLELRLGRSDEALTRAGRLEAVADSPRIGSLAHDLAAMIRATAAWQRHDVQRTLRELESQRFVIPDYRFDASPLFAHGESRMLRASALVQLGREDEALGWLSGLEYPANWSILGVLAAPAFRLEGEIHDRAGRRAEALRAYGTFLELWRNAGPEAQDQVGAVQSRVAALSGDS